MRIGGYVIPGAAFKGFRDDTSRVYSLALNPEGVLDDGTTVRPVVGSFAVDANGVTLRFKTINGLYYELLRAVGGFDMKRIDENGIGLIGDGNVRSLQDKSMDSSQGGAFYSLRVSLP